MDTLQGNSHPQSLPLGGKLSPEVTDEGATVSIPFRPTDSPGRAAGPGGSPQKRPKGPHLPFRPTDSPGRACLAEFRRPQPAEKDEIIF